MSTLGRGIGGGGEGRVGRDAWGRRLSLGLDGDEERGGGERGVVVGSWISGRIYAPLSCMCRKITQCIARQIAFLASNAGYL